MRTRVYAAFQLRIHAFSLMRLTWTSWRRLRPPTAQRARSFQAVTGWRDLLPLWERCWDARGRIRLAVLCANHVRRSEAITLEDQSVRHQFPTFAFNSSKKFSTKINSPASAPSPRRIITNRWSSSASRGA